MKNENTRRPGSTAGRSSSAAGKNRKPTGTRGPAKNGPKKAEKVLPPTVGKMLGKKLVPAFAPKPLFAEDGSVTVKDAVLETVCGTKSEFPDNGKPEIAFAGKSNVGKSSLLNALVGRKALARISAQPGKTQTINFYRVNGLLYFVDLPGYGYAAQSEEVKASWGRMIERYLQTSKDLKTVFLLVDIRHQPSENDCMMYDWIVRAGLNAVIIATKQDKINRSQVAKQVKMIRETLGCPKETPVIPFSSQTKSGREEVFRVIGEAAGLRQTNGEAQ